MGDVTADDLDVLRRIDGLHVGMLTDDEQEILRRLVREGYAIRSYDGPAGLLGIAHVRSTGSRTASPTAE